MDRQKCNYVQNLAGKTNTKFFKLIKKISIKLNYKKVFIQF